MLSGVGPADDRRRRVARTDHHELVHLALAHRRDVIAIWVFRYQFRRCGRTADGERHEVQSKIMIEKSNEP